MNRMVINTLNSTSKISKNIYGHFSEHLGRCIYNGLYVGEDSKIPNVRGMRTDIVEALKGIRVPVLRWPGGCFADEYHWKDGIGPKESRKKMINTHWGGVTEDNSFGTHEFLDFCEQVGCEPYVNGNVGSGTVQEMSEWVEYMTFDGLSPMAELRARNGREKPWALKYFGVGNENWGCGGNMRPEYYADLYRRFQTYVRNYGDNQIFKIVCGPNVDDYHWTDTVMEIAGRFANGISLHYYTIPNEWDKKGSATEFSAGDYYRTLKKALHMEELVTNHLAIMNKHDPAHKVGLIVDEWGAWYDVEPGTNPGFLYQQNTMRDALIAAVTLNIFNRHSDRVVMANIAQMINVLQSIILTEGDKMLLTPTYHVFDLYKEHQEAMLADCFLETAEIPGEGVPDLSASASVKDGVLTVTLANLSASESRAVSCTLAGMKANALTGRILSGTIQAKNDFECPAAVRPVPFEGFTLTGTGFDLEIPACSVMEIQVK